MCLYSRRDDKGKKTDDAYEEGTCRWDRFKASVRSSCENGVPCVGALALPFAWAKSLPFGAIDGFSFSFCDSERPSAVCCLESGANKLISLQTAAVRSGRLKPTV
jgi:hypothetical protein